MWLSEGPPGALVNIKDGIYGWVMNICAWHRMWCQLPANWNNISILLFMKQSFLKEAILQANSAVYYRDLFRPPGDSSLFPDPTCNCFVSLTDWENSRVPAVIEVAPVQRVLAHCCIGIVIRIFFLTKTSTGINWLRHLSSVLANITIRDNEISCASWWKTHHYLWSKFAGKKKKKEQTNKQTWIRSSCYNLQEI